MNKDKSKIIISIILNIIILVPTLIFVIHGILYGVGGAQPGDNIQGLGYFKPYTMDSNIFSIFSSLLIIIFDIKSLVTKKNTMPKFGIIIHLMSTACLALTFLITLLFLTPMFYISKHNLFLMYEEELLLFHFINPILSFISFVYLIKYFDYKKKDVFLGEIPTLIYSIIYLLMVIVFHKWKDFYNFTLNGKYYLVPFVFIIINVIAYFISLLLIKFNLRKNMN